VQVGVVTSNSKDETAIQSFQQIFIANTPVSQTRPVTSL